MLMRKTASTEMHYTGIVVNNILKCLSTSWKTYKLLICCEKRSSDVNPTMYQVLFNYKKVLNNDNNKQTLLQLKI